MNSLFVFFDKMWRCLCWNFRFYLSLRFHFNASIEMSEHLIKFSAVSAKFWKSPMFTSQGMVTLRSLLQTIRYTYLMANIQLKLHPLWGCRTSIIPTYDPIINKKKDTPYVPSRHPQCTSPTHFLFSFMETTNKASIFSLRVGFRNLGDFCTFILFKCHSRASFYRFITSSSFLGILSS